MQKIKSDPILNSRDMLKSNLDRYSSFESLNNRGLTTRELFFYLLLGLLLLYIAVRQYDYIESNVSAISCRQNCRNLTSSLNELFNLFPAERSNFVMLKEIDINKLENDRMINYHPICNMGGKYKLSPYGEVYCSFHNPEME